MGGIMIKTIELPDRVADVIDVIHRSFGTVAKEYGYTKDKAPTFPAFLPASDVLEMSGRGATFIGAYDEDRLIGTVAVEHARGEMFYLERLAVLPEYRHSGLGKKLMDAAFEEVHRLRGKTVSIAVVDENRPLKAWYTAYGFHITQTKRYEYLPFAVTFMKKDV